MLVEIRSLQSLAGAWYLTYDLRCLPENAVWPLRSRATFVTLYDPSQWLGAPSSLSFTSQASFSKDAGSEPMGGGGASVCLQ